MSNTWKNCSSCKKPIALNSIYYICSVTTCQGRMTDYVFCSVPCWDSHVPVERHKPGAGALERRSPNQKIMVSTPVKQASSKKEEEILVVASKVRAYISDRSGFNTSGSLYEALSDKIRNLCDAAIDEAKAQGRKTVMDKDVS